MLAVTLALTKSEMVLFISTWSFGGVDLYKALGGTDMCKALAMMTETGNGGLFTEAEQRLVA